MRIIVDLDDVKTLAEGLKTLNDWKPEQDLLVYQCGSVRNGDFVPFDSPV